MTEAPAAEQERLSREFSFGGSLEAMSLARDQMMQFIGAHCVSEGEELDIMLALQEALANAVLHGCQNDAAKTVQCHVEVDPSGVAIVVRDPGPGFRLPSVAAAAAGENLSEQGRGIGLMRALMDEVEYQNGGSEVRLRKLHPAARLRVATAQATQLAD